MLTLISSSCISLIQPLNISINKPLKARIQDLTNQPIFDCKYIDDFEKWIVGDRWILTTWCVGNAWYQFCVEKQDLVKRVFRKVGLSLLIDGSSDYELDIKGFAEISIRDWIGETGVDEKSKISQFPDVNVDNDNCNTIEFVVDRESQIVYIHVVL